MADWLTAHSAEFESARRICAHHAKSFYFASRFLPRLKRFAAYAVYAFCRLLDDAADEAASNELAESRILAFEQTLEAVYRSEAVRLPDAEQERAIRAFQITAQVHNIPELYFRDLAHGVRMDLTLSRYATWSELETYCYHVAGVVGLVMCSIFGLESAGAKTNAVAMGNAMQLTNILRDVKEDLARGRIYLPQEDLSRFGVSEPDLQRGAMTDPIRSLLQFEIERARQLYATGAKGLAALPNDGSRLTASIMAVVYAGILRAIERADYDVFSRRAGLSTGSKAARVPRAWRLSRSVTDQTTRRAFW
jgi:phytoene synthase